MDRPGRRRSGLGRLRILEAAEEDCSNSGPLRAAALVLVEAEAP